MLYEKYGKVRSDERNTLLFDFPENGEGGMRMDREYNTFIREESF